MYNRYIPQPDGSFRRNRMEDMPRRNPRPEPDTHQTHPEPIQEVCPEQPSRQPIPPRPKKKPEPMGSFLKHLLPKDFDTEDLLIVLLLLLLSGDCREDQNSALLTLVLYLFL